MKKNKRKERERRRSLMKGSFAKDASFWSMLFDNLNGDEKMINNAYRRMKGMTNENIHKL